MESSTNKKNIRWISLLAGIFLALAGGYGLIKWGIAAQEIQGYLPFTVEVSLAEVTAPTLNGPTHIRELYPEWDGITRSPEEALMGEVASKTAAESAQEVDELEVKEATLNPEFPRSLEIPAVGLRAPVAFVQPKIISIAGEEALQWSAPDEFMVGWQNSSARLGEIGNTVLIGHHNIHGEVFKDLEDVEEGDLVLVYSSDHVYRYVVEKRMILEEKNATPEKRKENALWISRSEDERLTLVTCWPYQTNTHRLILVARPLDVKPSALDIQ